MICYRDRTYCEGPCDASDCGRQVTPEVQAAADRAGLPLAIMDLRDGCRRYVHPAPSVPQGGEETT